ncbi:MAG: sensor histidine kinase [Clostridia bacterium]|nr:sensor histidine kinase [Clostridia bacterium]
MFEIGINLIETYLIVEFITRFLGTKFDGKKRNVCFLVGWFVIFAELCIRNYITVLESFSAYIPIFFYCIYAFACLKGTFFTKIWISLFIHIIVISIAVLTNLAVCNLVGYDPYSMINVFNEIRIVSVILTKVILFYTTRIVLKIKFDNNNENSTWAMLTIVPMISVISILFLMRAAYEYSEVKDYVLLGIICIVIANIITYYFFNLTNKQHKDKLMIRLLKQQNENAIKNIEDSQSFINQMRVVKHDIKNQLLTIYNYIDTGNTNQAKKYIKDITDDYLPVSRTLVNTKNDAFNAVINAKTAICDNKGVFSEVKVDSEAIGLLDAYDTVAIFGNLLDNAIEAAECTELKRISVEVKRIDDYLSVLVGNSISASVLDVNSTLTSTKKNSEFHGIGLKSIKSIVKKYDGMIDFYEEENEFFCHIMLMLK